MRIYGIMISPTVLYGCETWSLTLREVYRQRIFENRMLKGICGPKKDERREVGENCIMSSLGK
jgi:hypothetical protein